MDVAAASNAPVNLKSVPATTMVEEENGDGGEPVAPPPAKRQCFDQEMNRVAEIVLVLSALGRMRAGESPTELELELMVEARSKLAGMCQEFTPKDIVGSDGVRAVIEDLGLNGNPKDQRLGLRAPKLTISEKLSLGKRKMEEAKKFLTPAVSTVYAPHLSQPNGGVASPGLAKNVSVANQWPTTVNATGSNFRVERPQMMLNGASQGTPNSAANYYAPSWSAQSQSTTISFSTASDKKVPIQSSVRVTDPSFRPFMSQTPPGTNQPVQGMRYGQTSSFGNSHSEIAKIIHKVLQPLVKQYPLWNPPSRDYMSRATTCQMCEATVNEVDTLVICDACEKAYHVKCLQANNMKGLSKSEWHCSRCVQASSGKPFPPIYGRTITKSTAKTTSSAAGVQSSTAKKVGSMDIKVNQQKPIVTTSPGAQNLPGFVSGAATTSRFETGSVNANATASAAKTTNIGPQGFKESLICSNISPAPGSLTETPNPAAIASTGAVTSNGLISKPLTPVGTMSSTSPLPVSNQVTTNATPNATPSTPITATVTGNGDISSTASATAGHSKLNADLTAQAHALTATSSSNSPPAVSRSETAKSTEDVAIGQALNADDGPQAALGNVARCENPSESKSHSDSLNDQTLSENGQESSKDATEKLASEICQNHPVESPAAVISDQDPKITAKPSVPQENSVYLRQETASQPPSLSSDYDSQTEKEAPSVQNSLQKVPGDSQEGKGSASLDDRHQEQPSDRESDKSDSIKGANDA
ncbi:unnamed protein product [Thlaspi arvense]|uniref:PHD-type domain-containing protein n=1 Tax=Thlaspi arvense TaxID=13288 RepID=A0AAU9S3B4_THLAR|nr:unnamed protein product [Thlaspi arvense]